MGKRYRLILRSFGAGAILILGGCFTYQEEAVFDEKGAGTLTFRMERGQQGFLEKVASEYAWDNPMEDEAKLGSAKPAGLKLESLKKTDSADGKVVFEGKFSFENLDAFSSWKGHREIEQVLGGITLRRDDETWIFERKIIPLNVGQVAEARKKTVGSKIVFKLTGPGRLLRHNAQKVENGKTCVWEGSLAEFLEKRDGQGSVLEARYSTAPSRWPWLLAILALGGFTLWFFRRRKRK